MYETLRAEEEGLICVMIVHVRSGFTCVTGCGIVCKCAGTLTAVVKLSNLGCVCVYERERSPDILGIHNGKQMCGILEFKAKHL